MSNVWISSDFHLGHKNIVLGCSEWKTKGACRGFKTLKEHDETIINTINKYVKEDDILYFLGDFSMGGRESVLKYRKMINCRTIHLCLGNHDIHIRKNALFSDGTRAHDLFTSIQDRITKKICKQNFVLDHYALRTWDKGHYGAIMCHGHSHDSLIPYEKLLNIADEPALYKTGDLYKQIDVTLEAAYRIFKEWRPFHVMEIINMMENRVNLGVDHHE